MTSHNLFTAVELFLKENPYYPCLLLVHPEIARLDKASQQILGRYAQSALSVGMVVSQALLTLPAKQRPRQAKQAFANAVSSQTPGPLLCNGIDLLFDPSLSLDPLQLFKETSRQTILIITWPGTYLGGILAYATHLHAHYQIWKQTDLCDYCVIPL